MEKIIEVKNLEVKYGKEIVLSNINLDIMENEFTAILGPNGAGKTTLLKAITGILKPTKGEIKILGKPVESIGNLSKFIGYVPQYIKENTNIPITVLNAIKMGRYPHLGILKYLREKDKKIIDEIIDFLNIMDFKEKLFSELSGGQKQRVLIARALVNEPKLLILDEPTSGLDVNTSEGLYSQLDKLHKKYNITILLVTHDVMAVSEIVSNIACLNRNLIVHGKPENVLTEENLKCLYGKHFMLFGHGDIPHIVVKKGGEK
jgi:zinc transport system ATP-binding protein